ESLAFDPANEGDGAVRRESLAFDPANEGDGAVRQESLAFDPANEGDGASQQPDPIGKVIQNHRIGTPEQLNWNKVEENSPITVQQEQVNRQWINNLMSHCNSMEYIPVGGRLIHFIEAWRYIGADQLVMKGIKTYWKSTQSPIVLADNCKVPNQQRSKVSEAELSRLTQKELEDGIVEEVRREDLKWTNPCFAISKQEKGKWKKITDCRIHNKHLCSNHFIMEDIHTL
ncbi:MAG: hypothetical protein EZS28_037195, partial [Streblomastix strix]